MLKAFLSAFLFFCLSPLWADTISEGTVVDASNIDSLKNDTFFGHPLSELVTPGQEVLVRKYGLRMRLVAPKNLYRPERWEAATKQYSGQVKMDPSTKLLTGYVAGQPFPDLDLADPDVGWKVAWNLQFGQFLFGDVTQTPAAGYYTSAKKGLEKTNALIVYNVKLKGRLHEPQLLPGGADEALERRQLVFVTAPYDAAGVGSYVQRYDDGRLDETWVYIKSVRRVRRVVANTWMDPIAGSDLLGDDLACFNAFPTWYQNFRVLRKQTVLLVRNAEVDPSLPVDKVFEMDKAPYWNPSDQPWEPTEVYVLEQTTPKEHPYSKRIAYYDHSTSGAWSCDMYDKKGELWKVFHPMVAQTVKGDGDWSLGSPFNFGVDVQRAHAIVFYNPWIWSDDPLQKPEEASPDNLESADRYTLENLQKRLGPNNYLAVTNKRRQMEGGGVGGTAAKMEVP